MKDVQLMQGLVPDKSLPILAASAATGVQVLLTGDTRHFCPLMQRSDLPLSVLTPADLVKSFRS